MGIPEDAIMEMKANFALPEEDKEAVVPTFVEITFVELDREEAKKIVEQYNKVASGLEEVTKVLPSGEVASSREEAEVSTEVAAGGFRRLLSKIFRKCTLMV